MPIASILTKTEPFWPVFLPPFLLLQASSPNPSILESLPQAPHCIPSISLSCTRMVTELYSFLVEDLRASYINVLLSSIELLALKVLVLQENFEYNHLGKCL